MGQDPGITKVYGFAYTDASPPIDHGRIMFEKEWKESFENGFGKFLGPNLVLRFKGSTSPAWEIVTKLSGEVVGQIDEEEGKLKVYSLDENWTTTIISAADKYSIWHETGKRG